VATFSVLLVPETSGIPVLDNIEAEDLPVVGDFIEIRGTVAQVTHVWPGEHAELRAIGRDMHVRRTGEIVATIEGRRPRT
jgi:hypothetical protein